MAGFYLLIEAGDVAALQLQLELDNSVLCSAGLSRNSFERGTETFRRDMRRIFQSDSSGGPSPPDHARDEGGAGDEGKA